MTNPLLLVIANPRFAWVKQSSVFKDVDCFVARGAPRNDDGLFWYVPNLDGWSARNDEPTLCHSNVSVPALPCLRTAPGVPGTTTLFHRLLSVTNSEVAVMRNTWSLIRI